MVSFLKGKKSMRKKENSYARRSIFATTARRIKAVNLPRLNARGGIRL